MKIGIIGAGFTGLAASYYLQKEGHDVTVFERDKKPGGLAIGYREKEWKWTLEEHYHHWFTNDSSVLDLARELSYEVITKRPRTSSFVEDGIFQLDSPLSLLRFPKLTLIERIRTGIAIGLLRYNPYWRFLEKYTAEPYLKKLMGIKAYKKIWQPLMTNKLGTYSKVVSLAWFWARVYKRTSSLSYPKGGFLEFANHIAKTVVNAGGKFFFDTKVIRINSLKKPTITYERGGRKYVSTFDKVIVTVPTPIFLNIAPQLPKRYFKKYSSLIGIGAVNMVLRMKKPFFKDKTYWLNMCDPLSPILAIVEHTNFMDKKHYNNEHLIYIGNYMETSDPRFVMSPEELLKIYDPWLSKINSNYKLHTTDYKLFRAPFAQPIIPVNYSRKIPPFKTPLPNIYLANIQQVYPWDRGTNYAVALGKNIVEEIRNDK